MSIIIQIRFIYNLPLTSFVGSLHADHYYYTRWYLTNDNLSCWNNWVTLGILSPINVFNHGLCFVFRILTLNSFFRQCVFVPIAMSFCTLLQKPCPAISSFTWLNTGVLIYFICNTRKDSSRMHDAHFSGWGRPTPL